MESAKTICIVAKAKTICHTKRRNTNLKIYLKKKKYMMHRRKPWHKLAQLGKS